MKSGKLQFRIGILSAIFLTLASCTTNPATGKKEFTPFMTPAQEREIGLQQHPQLLQQFGGAYDDPKVTSYVAAVGGKMAKNSELADQPFTFTLLNSKVVNAFALPGGYVYISRGLLGLINDEAELSSVLGHEVGHVTARHSANRYNRGVFTQILGAGIGIATGSGEAAQLFNQGSQAWLSGYSRDQEFQADSLGVRYLTRAGYDPFGAPRMLDSLGKETALQARVLGQDEAERIPAWARTHPLTQDRVAKALETARATGIAPNTSARNRDAFLAAIDGMIYDDDPKQGIIKGKEFWHGMLGFMFAVPEGFALQNSETSVLANGPEGSAILFSTASAPNNSDMQDYIRQVWAGLTNNPNANLTSTESITINGMAAATGVTRITSGNTALDFRVVGIKYDARRAYHFIFVSNVQATAGLADAYRRTTYSFRKLSADEAKSVVARRIRIITVKAGDTAASLAKKMAYEDNQLDRFLILNGMENARQLRAGEKVKLVVYDAY